MGIVQVYAKRHLITRFDTFNADPSFACPGWQRARCSCCWHDITFPLKIFGHMHSFLMPLSLCIFLPGYFECPPKYGLFARESNLRRLQARVEWLTLKLNGKFHGSAPDDSDLIDYGHHSMPGRRRLGPLCAVANQKCMARKPN